MKKTINIVTIVKRFGLEFLGTDISIDGLGLCNRETSNNKILSYVVNEKYVEFVKKNEAVVCLILTRDMLESYREEVIGRKITYIISDEPEICFYTIHEMLCKEMDFYERYNFEPKLGIGCNIAESAVIEKGTIIGNYVTIGSNTVVRSGSIIDDNVTIGCNTTIGSEGFQLITEKNRFPMHITHVGRCHICTNVYVGDNTCICNSLFDGETYIGEGSKIDNLVHIAHNIYVGRGAVITAHVIACGSSIIGENAWIAPNVSILNRVKIGEGAKVGLGSVVTHDVDPYTVVYGSPAKVHIK